MGKPSILISIDTKCKTEAKTFGLEFMQRLIDEDPRLIPELVSRSERFADPFVNIERFVDEWWSVPIKTYLDGKLTGERFEGALWKRKSALAGRGKIDHGIVNNKGQRLPSNLWFESRWDKRADFENLFRKWISLAEPVIGMLHLFTDNERSVLSGESGSWFQTGSFGGPAKPGIPEMGWAMAYGDEYLPEVDVHKISAAGYPVDHIGGATVIRVTENLSDVVEDFSLFTKRRAELKSFFRPELFWVKG